MITLRRPSIANPLSISDRHIGRGSETVVLNRLLVEPPFRLLGKLAARYLPCRFESKVFWEALVRPQYAAGVFFAAAEAQRLQFSEISVLEFGVANGAGLRILERHAAAASREFGVAISVFGFDRGTGLPAPIDFRDHPDAWRMGDYPMNADGLRAQVGAHTHLVLGDVAETVPGFVKNQRFPVGFVSVDLDLYSSTRDALRLFTLPRRQMLPHTAMYFDETLMAFNHHFAGELLAIEEFNSENDAVKIDRWRAVRTLTAFPESPWLDAMYMAHDLQAEATKGTPILARSVSRFCGFHQ